MSQAEELLNSLDLESGEAGSGDKERHIVIGRDRCITVPEELKKIAVQYDHDIETVTFDCPRYWDEHDMSTMKVYVNYIRSDGYMDKKLCSTPVVDEANSEIMHFDWTISGNVTKMQGTLRFLVCIKKTDAAGNEENHWNSELNEDMYISEGLEPDGNILPEQKDIITDLLVRMEKAESVLDMSWVNATDEELERLENDKVNKSGDTVTGDLQVDGALTTPNAASEPETANLFDKYSTRKTASYHEIVDKSFAEVQRIVGATVKTKNLIPYPYATAAATVNGVTFSVNSDGSITMNGTAIANATFGLCGNATNLSGLETGKTYTIGEFGVRGKYQYQLNYYKNGSPAFAAGSISDDTHTFTVGDDWEGVFLYIVVLSGTTVNNVICRPMLNAGTKALPYTPYFSGLKHAFINSIKSTGRNLLNLPEEYTFTGIKRLTGIKLSAGTYTFSVDSYVHDGSSAPVVVFQNTDTVTNEKACYLDMGTQTFELAGGTYTIQFYANGWSYPNSDGVTSTIRGFMLNRGNKPYPYEPYTEDIYQLPETVELAGGDTIDVVARKKITRVKTITLDASVSGWQTLPTNTSGVYRIFLPLGDHYDEADTPTVISNYYDSTTADGTYSRLKGVGMNADGITIFDPDFSTNNLSLWRTHLAELYDDGKPLVIEYQLKEPVESDIIIPKKYIVYDKGSETIIQGEEDNSRYGAMPAVLAKYYLMANPDETATKEFALKAATMMGADCFYADEAGHAVNADEAKHALKADHAIKADAADNAARALDADTAGVASFAIDSEKINGINVPVTENRLSFVNTVGPVVPKIASSQPGDGTVRIQFSASSSVLTQNLKEAIVANGEMWYDDESCVPYLYSGTVLCANVSTDSIFYKIATGSVTPTEYQGEAIDIKYHVYPERALTADVLQVTDKYIIDNRNDETVQEVSITEPGVYLVEIKYKSSEQDIEEGTRRATDIIVIRDTLDAIYHGTLTRMRYDASEVHPVLEYLSGKLGINQKIYNTFAEISNSDRRNVTISRVTKLAGLPG